MAQLEKEELVDNDVVKNTTYHYGTPAKKDFTPEEVKTILDMGAHIGKRTSFILSTRDKDILSHPEYIEMAIGEVEAESKLPSDLCDSFKEIFKDEPVEVSRNALKSIMEGQRSYLGDSLTHCLKLTAAVVNSPDFIHRNEISQMEIDVQALGFFDAILDVYNPCLGPEMKKVAMEKLSPAAIQQGVAVGKLIEHFTKKQLPLSGIEHQTVEGIGKIDRQVVVNQLKRETAFIKLMRADNLKINPREAELKKLAPGEVTDFSKFAPQRKRDVVKTTLKEAMEKIAKGFDKVQTKAKETAHKVKIDLGIGKKNGTKTPDPAKKNSEFELTSEKAKEL